MWRHSGSLEVLAESLEQALGRLCEVAGQTIEGSEDFPLPRLRVVFGEPEVRSAHRQPRPILGATDVVERLEPAVVKLTPRPSAAGRDLPKRLEKHLHEELFCFPAGGDSKLSDLGDSIGNRLPIQACKSQRFRCLPVDSYVVGRGLSSARGGRARARR